MLILKLTNVRGCTLIVHQRICIRIRQILIYKIRIRRRRISAGSVTSLSTLHTICSLCPKWHILVINCGLLSRQWQHKRPRHISSMTVHQTLYNWPFLVVWSFQQSSEQTCQASVIANSRLCVGNCWQHVVALHVGILLIHPSKCQVTSVPQVGEDVYNKL